MVDMTNNRVPYGLLTDEEKAALHNHYEAGGVVSIHLDQQWVVASKAREPWAVYRTVPLPAKTQDVIAWEKLPDWVEWVARDKFDDYVSCYENEPHQEYDWWAVDEKEARRIDDFPGIVVQIGTCDWKESKQRRPR
jgi:hypothetical protein